MEPVLDPLDKKHEEAVLNFGALRYPPEKMAIVLGVEEAKIRAAMKDKKSPFYLTYLKGQTMADYVMDLKLFELAKAGDLKAMEIIRGLSKKRKPDEV